MRANSATKKRKKEKGRKSSGLTSFANAKLRACWLRLLLGHLLHSFGKKRWCLSSSTQQEFQGRRKEEEKKVFLSPFSAEEKARTSPFWCSSGSINRVGKSAAFAGWKWRELVGRCLCFIPMEEGKALWPRRKRVQRVPLCNAVVSALICLSYTVYPKHLASRNTL